MSEDQIFATANKLVSAQDVHRLMLISDLGQALRLSQNLIDGNYCWDGIDYQSQIRLLAQDLPTENLIFYLEGDDSIRIEEVRVMTTTSISPFVGLVLPAWSRTYEGKRPQTLAVGQKMALIIQGLYLVYERLEEQYKIYCLQYDQANVLGFHYRYMSDTREYELLNETVYGKSFCDFSDILHPVGHESFPVPLPDIVEWISQPIGQPELGLEY